MVPVIIGSRKLTLLRTCISSGRPFVRLISEAGLFARASLAANWFGRNGGYRHRSYCRCFPDDLIAVGGTRVLHGQLTVGQLIAFQMYGAMLGQPIQRLVQTLALDAASFIPLYDRVVPFFIPIADFRSQSTREVRSATS